jgi:chorismate-pyruvate lyase
MLTQSHTELELLYPLTLFRRKGGGPLPQYEVIEGAAMPEPYRKLLVHNGDMTSRLEAFHGGSIVLQLLQSEFTEDAYRREVVLHVEDRGLAVEYGAIEIHLDAFEPELRAQILEEHLPLGGLLNHYKVRYYSRPRGFFRLGRDIEMNALFSASGAREFYGRSNELLGENDRLLATIVEVLRP